MRRIATVACLALAILFLSPQTTLAYGGPSSRTTKSKPRAVKKSKKAKKAKPHFLFVLFPELKPALPEGTSLALQNRIADENNLPRIQNSEELHSLQKGESPYLVPAGKRLGCFRVDERLANKSFKVSVEGSKTKKKIREDFRYLNPDAVAYVSKRLAGRYCPLSLKNRHKAFMISSLVRTQEYQKVLARVNPNARDAIGDRDDNRSAHLTGYALDISTKGHTRKELIDLARLLLEDKKEGYLAEVIFEPRLRNFHMMVFPKQAFQP